MNVTSKPSRTPLRRAVTGPLLFLFILGDVLGAGVYALAGTIAGQVGGAIWVPLLVALFFAMLTAGSYAELVTKYPQAGAASVFAEKAFRSPFLSFLVGFCMLAAAVTSAAGLSLAFAGDYLATFTHVPPHIAALVFLVMIALLNARGIKESLGANLVMTLIELSGLILVIVAAAWFFRSGDAHLHSALQFKPGVSPWLAVLSAALLAFYSFVGFETSANLAEEIRDVRKVYPRALFAALLTAGVVYMAVGVAAASVLPMEELVATSAPLLEVVRASGLSVSPRVFAFIALVAVANGALLTMIMASRLAYGMACQGLLPGGLGASPAQKAHTVGRDHRHHPGLHRVDADRLSRHIGRDRRALAAFCFPQHQPGGVGAAPRSGGASAFSGAHLGAPPCDRLVPGLAQPAKPGNLVARRRPGRCGRSAVSVHANGNACGRKTRLGVWLQTDAGDRRRSRKPGLCRFREG